MYYLMGPIEGENSENKAYEIDETTKEITKVSAIELWCINLNTYRGFVSSLTELNETNLPDHISAVLAEANITL